MSKKKATSLQGLGVSPGIATGAVQIIIHGKLPHTFREGDVLVMVVSAFAMVTLRHATFSHHYSKYALLVGGAVIALLGVVLIVRPGWLAVG
ncbi:MAG: hypothetical protein HYZ09_00090 [Candidatus Kerfeldbacteria bacterium]|nr:hypothetical protein [Candidatus Kerfeldbacteria bacterium]